MAQATTPLSGIARALVQQGRLQEADAEAIHAQAQTSNSTFVQALVASKKLNAAQIAEFAATTFGYPLLDLAQLDSAYIPPGVLDPKLMQTRRIVPLYKRGTKLFVGISDPTNIKALEDAKFQTGAMIEPVVVEDNKLGQLIEKLIEASGANLKDLVVDQDEMDIAGGDEPSAEPEGASLDVDDAPVVKYIQKVLLDAINSGASDIHFEPYEKFYRVRYRIDGVLREVAQPPLAIKDKMASRIKVISKLDISEKRVPQDGRMKLVLSKSRAIDFRVSTLPTLFGEKICMRILDPSSATLGIDALGYEPDQKAALLEAVHRPYGMVLVTGPTGSGKTVSLYTCLNILNEPGINISTAEDPAEINLPGINQVNVNDKAGLTFAAALKSFLRQDPDIIMVGEIRDLETADISIKAAQTGHMVFSTLHTNDAPATLSRMLNMGIAPFNIASAVILITGQRLARKLCSACKKPIDIPPEALIKAGFLPEELDGSWQPYGPVGCDTCKGSGYKGRVGIYQVMPISEEMQRIIMRQGNSIELADQARREGVRDLRQSGLLKVKQGMTSLTEVEAVTNE
ncbi:type IV-A pilus assembly ATPase PilB [Chitinimonas sp. BJB300]|uniref:type IV-A pilus assembly ATPase PilB n=1 Tax=Chitinimonas sp. BJB300 TaxID=1559339 RepID=UPI000C0EDAB9|nr:type IV-A pilus assembly ATPase PilB [Chitinimonas sp. BJB300]PHV10345.1 type IV-A pilus assembly ATPase PilB [Chitinimonas sp. BJB300]TSJ90823.1 type IV-A pilus assembly ATPase PilB [Chitinimonas sp. BJB300]